MSQKFTKEEREQLEQDPLHRFYSRVEAYFYNNYKAIIGVGAGVIVVIALSIGYYFYSQSQEDQAQQMLGFAEEMYRNGNYEQALTGNQQDLVAGFNDIINNYPRTYAANLAYYYAAVCEYELDNPKQALSRIKDHEPAEGILGVGPVSFYAAVLNELERYEDAGQRFVKAAEWDINDATTPFNLLKAAQAYQLGGRNQQAYDLVDRMLNEYPDHSMTDQAERLKGRLMMALNE